MPAAAATPVMADLRLVLPEVILALVATALLAGGFVGVGKNRARLLAGMALGGLVVAFLALWPGYRELTGAEGNNMMGLFSQMLVADRFGLFFRATFIAVAAMVVMYSTRYVEQHNLPAAEFYSLVLFAAVGMMLMAGSIELITIYIGLELTSISSYILAGLMRNDPKSNEAAIKYFLTGSIASAVFLFGISLLYGLTGTTNLVAMWMVDPSATAVTGPAWNVLMAVASVFILGGLGFKVAAVPFHMWAPDTYEGAPTPVTGFFSVGPKGAAFAALLRIFPLGIVLLSTRWIGIMTVVAVITMTLGNLSALLQTNVKRMLAYSSIAQAGYILVGFAAAAGGGAGGVMFYVVAYAFINLGVFAVILHLSTHGQGETVESFNGLAQRSPAIAAAMVVFLLGLIGVPFTSGFFAKFYIFGAAVNAGLAWLAVVMAVNSAVSVGYYYVIVRNMYLVQPPEGSGKLAVTPGLAVTITVATLMTLALGLASQPVIGWISSSAGM